MRTVAIAQLRNVPTSPRRMRQVADNIRGLGVDKALGILEFSTRHASEPLYKLLRSAIANWEANPTLSVISRYSLAGSVAGADT